MMLVHFAQLFNSNFKNIKYLKKPFISPRIGRVSQKYRTSQQFHSFFKSRNTVSILLGLSLYERKPLFHVESEESLKNAKQAVPYFWDPGMQFLF
jgi:hypothetical protein